ncbi:hypothetical protein GS501_02565 [Saccharibacter sp. 17.LH.SD]|uniref:transposase domain-containing protein n=1 Tax=Saccharibacter sp. 17.LH.SD TaxID=2689393 RepID=UPI00136F9D61|nr:transposase domain-containing protein [Saccharibacter sp. 17.LH.SD]MXV43936.1 hypothetical protein [Saccharibacter sp. 17.LH.SD]
MAWLSSAELTNLKLPGIPTTVRGLHLRAENEGWLDPRREGELWRIRSGRGGGYEFNTDMFPLGTKVALALKTSIVPQKEESSSVLWQNYERLSDSAKERAQRNHRILMAYQTLVDSGVKKGEAVAAIIETSGIARRTLYTNLRKVRGIARTDWLPALADGAQRAGRKKIDIPEDLWEMLKADYLRLSQPRFSDCYRRIVAKADEHGITLPCEKTLYRRIQELPVEVRVLSRDGMQRLKQLYPAQERDRTVFHALQAVNSDGHRWDVFVKWPDNTIGRPVMVGFQDLYSGKILSWRVDRSENTEAVRLAFGDLVEDYGIPEMCFLDNGRNFASKWLTGGIPNRFRFKVREEEPLGLLPQLGVQVHWATPYAGQSKPIERAWRDFAQSIAKHPRFEGAYTGNSPVTKPENYASKAVSIEEFLAVVAEGIAEHNARKGRRSAVCAGIRSFDEVFAESYAASAITKATAEQRRLWLLAAEGQRANTRDGSLRLLGNRYWSSELLEHRGQNLVVRFDPENMHQPVHVYLQSGAYLCSAECVDAVGFADQQAAQTHGRARRQFMRAAKEQRDAEVQMTPQQLADHCTPQEPEKEFLESKVVRPFRPQTSGAAALAVEPAFIADDEEEVGRNARLLRLIKSDQ